MKIVDDGSNLIQDLTGKKVLIYGGTGNVGEGMLRTYLKSNALIIIPTRSSESRDNFLELLGEEGQTDKLKFVVGDYSTFEGSEQMAKDIEGNFGEIDHVIASIGGWWSGGPFWRVSEHAWNKQFIGLATSHAAIARAWIPRLGANSSYQIIAGGSGTHPVDGSGIVSMQQASLIMMAEVLALEAEGKTRVFAFVLGVVDGRKRPQHKPHWITAEQVGMVSGILASQEYLKSQVIHLKDKAALPGLLDKLDIKGW